MNSQDIMDRQSMLTPNHAYDHIRSTATTHLCKYSAARSFFIFPPPVLPSHGELFSRINGDFSVLLPAGFCNNFIHLFILIVYFMLYTLTVVLQ